MGREDFRKMMAGSYDNWDMHFSRMAENEETEAAVKPPEIIKPKEKRANGKTIKADSRKAA